MHDHLDDLGSGQPVAQAGAQVHRQLALGAQRGEHGDRDARPGAPVEMLVARPQRAPRRLREVALEVGVELGGGRHRPVDVVVAEDLAPHAHAGQVAVVVSHRCLPSGGPAATR